MVLKNACRDAWSRLVVGRALGSLSPRFDGSVNGPGWWPRQTASIELSVYASRCRGCEADLRQGSEVAVQIGQDDNISNEYVV